MVDLCRVYNSKPILVSNWSGHKDFLPEENTVYLEGELKKYINQHKTNFYLKNQNGLQLIIQKQLVLYLMFIKTIKHILKNHKD